jgi:hypothetical protein
MKWLQTDLEASDTIQRRYQNLRHLILIVKWKDCTYKDHKGTENIRYRPQK